jgi:hypothetical protein
MSEVPFALTIGSIMYAMIYTRPDVSFALSATSRHQSDPGKEHWVAVKRILKYLRITKGLLIRPFCITILYHNLLLFIDIFYI